MEKFTIFELGHRETWLVGYPLHEVRFYTQPNTLLIYLDIVSFCNARFVFKRYFSPAHMKFLYRQLA